MVMGRGRGVPLSVGQLLGASKNHWLTPGSPCGGGLWRRGWRHEAFRRGFTPSSTSGVRGVSRRFGVLRSSLLLLVLLLSACQADEPEQRGQMPPPPVVYATFAPTTATASSEYAGRAHGSRKIEVRARAEGILEERLYVEGQRVERGAELFILDSDPYEIALRRAEAELANAQARHRQAERDWQRLDRLFEEDAISAHERDKALSQLELAKAGVELAKAGVASARLNLDWTRVTAPIAGITGLEAFSAGSLISAGTLLTTITQIDPIHIRFALPEGDAPLQRAARQAISYAGQGGSKEHRRTITLRLPDDSDYPHRGAVDFTDVSIDPRTGSITARAVFANPEGQIMPGQFVRLSMATQHFEKVMLLPEEAIAQGGSGSQVFVVEAGDKVGVRPVELGPVIEGRQVVLSGISDQDRVIVRGLNNLREGMPVQPRPVNGGQ